MIITDAYGKYFEDLQWRDSKLNEKLDSYGWKRRKNVERLSPSEMAMIETTFSDTWLIDVVKNNPDSAPVFSGVNCEDNEAMVLNNYIVEEFGSMHDKIDNTELADWARLVSGFFGKEAKYNSYWLSYYVLREIRK